MKVLVTGAAGQVGATLLPHLVALGHEVVAVDLVPGRTTPGVAWSALDVTDGARMQEALPGVDAIVHLAALGQPWLASEEEILRVNVQGTFAVYAAAVAAGVRRVVTASSINALGLYFGRRRVPVEVVPVPESHPRVTSDPYSFSKRLAEDVAEYFHHRAGITSLAFRMGGGMQLEPRPAAPEIRAAVAELLDLPRDEGRRRVRELIDAFFARSSDLRRRYDGPYVENVLATGATHLWTALDVRDRDDAVARALTAPIEGAHVVQLADSHNSLGLPSRELADLFYPEARVDDGLQGTDSLWSLARARELLEFAPQYSVSRYFDAPRRG